VASTAGGGVARTVGAGAAAVLKLASPGPCAILAAARRGTAAATALTEASHAWQAPAARPQPRARDINDGSKDLAALGVNTVAISSNDAASYPADGFDHMRRWAEEKGFPFKYLHDEGQEVARAYGAVCTPDFFGYDADLGLQYRGRLDASKTTLVEGARRELYEAMRQVAETGRGPAEQTPSMGCSIKWKEAA
jgi:hypothetical protein